MVNEIGRDNLSYAWRTFPEPAVFRKEMAISFFVIMQWSLFCDFIDLQEDWLADTRSEMHRATDHRRNAASKRRCAKHR